MNRLDTTDTDHVSLPDTTVGRARAVLAGAGLILGLAAAGLLGATQAVAATPTFAVTASPYLNEHSGPSTADATVGTIAHGLKVTISCQTTGSTYFGTNIWDKLPDGSYVTDDLLTTPVYDGYSPGLNRCSIPTPPPSTVKTGLKASGNEGTAGQCTWWAINEFHTRSGIYPYLIDSVDNGNAQYWATNAAHDGWTVSAVPRVDSIVVFPPGVNGALGDGHVAWVTGVAGGRITFTEMNGPAGPFNVDTRTVTPAASVRYILAP